jgi:ATP-dependent RNA helicase RhlE
MFFSATMPKEIASLAGELLVSPVRVEVTPAASTVARISQQVIHLTTSNKLTVLIDLLRDAAVTKSLVFTRTKRGADKLTRGLASAEIDATAIHGNKSQAQRERALRNFRKGETRVLVATDIAARGIDIGDISHVVNYDLPQVAESYVHRIGRTARAGAAGVAISLCDPEQRTLLRDIERLIRTEISPIDHPLSVAAPVADRARGIRSDDMAGKSRLGRSHQSRHKQRTRKTEPHTGRSDAPGRQAARKRNRRRAHV